ncbi:MAG: class I SAM-dependent methyltransferase [Chloroflexota bacterium]|nr:class I SAM-dependent methyltransferase [Chloroflexota bacterium]
MRGPTRSFEQLIAEAEQQPFSGWDFAYLHGRMEEAETSWNYAELVRARLAGVPAVLDLGTGGGEFLARLAPLPSRTVATEGYPSNVAIAQVRLGPLGVEVVPVVGAPDNRDQQRSQGSGTLPFPDASFPLVINRHESYYPAEINRILQGGGSFMTQQVGAAHYQELKTLFDRPPARDPLWNLTFAVEQLEQAGFRVVDRREEFPETVFRDVGAVVYYLRAVPWDVPGFAVQRYRERLVELHRRIEAEGGLRIRGHVFYIEAHPSER